MVNPGSLVPRWWRRDSGYRERIRELEALAERRGQEVSRKRDRVHALEADLEEARAEARGWEANWTQGTRIWGKVEEQRNTARADLATAQQEAARQRGHLEAIRDHVWDAERNEAERLESIAGRVELALGGEPRG